MANRTPFSILVEKSKISAVMFSRYFGAYKFYLFLLFKILLGPVDDLKKAGYSWYRPNLNMSMNLFIFH